MLKIKRVGWDTVESAPCAILVGGDETGAEAAIAIPIAAFLVLGAQAKARLSAAEFAKAKQVLPRPWHHARFTPVRTAQVGIVESREPREVGLILDPDLGTELSLSLRPEDAREVAQRLLAAAMEIEEEHNDPSLN